MVSEIFKDFHVVLFADSKTEESFAKNDLVYIVNYFCSAGFTGQEMVNSKTKEFLFYTPRLGNCVVSNNGKFLRFKDENSAYASALSFKKYMLSLNSNSRKFLFDVKKYIK